MEKYPDPDAVLDWPDEMKAQLPKRPRTGIPCLDTEALMASLASKDDEQALLAEFEAIDPATVPPDLLPRYEALKARLKK